MVRYQPAVGCNASLFLGLRPAYLLPFSTYLIMDVSNYLAIPVEFDISRFDCTNAYDGRSWAPGALVLLRVDRGVAFFSCDAPCYWPGVSTCVSSVRHRDDAPCCRLNFARGAPETAPPVVVSSGMRASRLLAAAGAAWCRYCPLLRPFRRTWCCLQAKHEALCQVVHERRRVGGVRARKGARCCPSRPYQQACHVHSTKLSVFLINY